VQVGERANLGMGAVVHQFRVVGGGAMVGMGAAVTRDVPPYAKAFGNPARVRGADTVGLRRAGVPDGPIEALAAALRVPGAGPTAEAYDAAGLAGAWEWFAGAARGD
jgi:UDP-N-acetylglucosamine acyltransferase